MVRLGFGGKILGVRGGISTKGIGVGAGPFSAGTSWKSSRSKSTGSKRATSTRKSAATRKNSQPPGLLSALAGLAVVAGEVVDGIERRQQADKERARRVERGARNELAGGRNAGKGDEWIAVAAVAMVGVTAMTIVALFSHEPPSACLGSPATGNLMLPGVAGQKAPDARERLEDLGLSVEVKPSEHSGYSSVWNESNWTVENTTPVACSEVPRGSSVRLNVDK